MSVSSKASAASASEFERRCSGSCRLYHNRRCCWSETSTLQVGFLFSVLSVHVFFLGGGRGVTPQTLCVASVTLLDGLALVMLAWQAEPRCLDVKHTQNTMQPSKSASTVVVVLTSAHFVQTAMLSLTSHQLEQHAAGEPRKIAWKNASKEGSLNSRRRCETMLATRKLDNRACGPPMNVNFGLLVHGE